MFKQASDGPGLGVYVDDFELVAPKGKSAAIWKELEKHIEFKELPKYWDKKPTRHLGFHYTVEQKQVATGDLVTTVKAHMKEYFEDIVRRFEERTGVKVPDAPTPWLDARAEKGYEKETAEEGLFGSISISAYGWSLRCKGNQARPHYLYPQACTSYQ